MTTIDNQQLDALISDSLERHEVLESIHREVMTEVRRAERREALRRWARVAAFAFGIPLVMLCFGVGIHLLCTHVDMQQPYMWIGVALSAIALTTGLGRAVSDFSVSEV